MTNNKITYNVLFFPDKEKADSTQENTFIEVDKKTGKQKYYNFDAKLRVRIRWSVGVLNFNVGERVELAKWSNVVVLCVEDGPERCHRGVFMDIVREIAPEVVDRT